MPVWPVGVVLWMLTAWADGDFVGGMVFADVEACEDRREMVLLLRPDLRVTECVPVSSPAIARDRSADPPEAD